VDGAEGDERAATSINADGAGRLAERCRTVGATLLHFSTDYVFDGKAAQPYSTDHPISPINAYGRSKAAGEMAIRESGCEHLIVRTSSLYAPWGANFVRTMVRLGKEKDSLRVVDDQRARPTSAEYLAERSFGLIERGARGTYHIADGGSCSWYEFAVEIMRLTGSSSRVAPCSSDEFPRPAARPRYSVLDTESADALLGPPQDWKDNLAQVVLALSGESAA
jgi:dTDP-4-dehydrorhamnose reductase